MNTSAAAQVARLSSGALDIGLLRPPVRVPELDVEIVAREPLLAVLPAAHPSPHRPRSASLTSKP